MILKKKLDIELEELCLKAHKEQLELEAQISASDAKIKVYTEYEGGQDIMSQKASTQQFKGHNFKEDDETQKERFAASAGSQHPAQDAKVSLKASPQRITGLTVPHNQPQQAGCSICSSSQVENPKT